MDCLQRSKTISPKPELEKQLKALDKAKPIKPKVPQLLFQDVTPEALSFELYKVWASGAVISAEAGIVFGSHGMGQDSVMRNLATLNILWDGGELKVSRRTQESYSLIGARLTVSLQVQEPTIRNFIAKSGGLARGTGFLARFLIAQPASTQGERPYTESPLDWPYLDAFNARILAILNSPQPQDEGSYLAPQLEFFSQEAKELWVLAHNEIESKLKGELFQIRDVASKTADNIARLACLFHKFSGESGPISAEHLEAACRIGIWHLDQSRRFLSKLERSPQEVNADRLFEWIQNECAKSETVSITQRHTQQYGPIREHKALNETIKFLVTRNYIEVIKERKSTLIKPKPQQSGQDE
jgi:putative DNA primase/helicase